MIGKLNQKEEAALREFTKILRGKYSDRIKMLLLYGSKARGDYHKESDIDVFVLIDKGDYKIRDEIVDIAADLLLKHEVLISPRVINMGEYNTLTRWKASFIKNIQKEGIKIE